MADDKRERYEAAIDKAFWAILRALNAASDLDDAAAEDELALVVSLLCRLEFESVNGKGGNSTASTRLHHRGLGGSAT